MAEQKEFQGFSKETVKFFKDLKKNNTKQWFGAHKQDHVTFVMQPARAFVMDMGDKLRIQVPDIVAVPKINKSLFRINRDTRFSPDKSPYKTNMGIFFWEGIRPRMECSGFYFHMEPNTLLLGVGLYMFPKYLFDTYRNSVVHAKYGKDLAEIVAKIEKTKGYQIGGKHYKRVPAGYDPSHPNADLLLHNGIHVGVESTIPEEFYSRKLVNYCWQKFRPLLPLHAWLVAMTRRYRKGL
ncbi:MAG: DUF2461 domain-containing protein [Candidatus Aminicenantes bacterium]|nr:MAG: DUF2461 domain-containing protein [Candidatus Aminicenantes bacterium]